MTRPIGYSYVRFSSKKQGKGSSLHRQTQDTLAGESPESWCAKNGVTFDTSLTFRDLGASAYRGEKQGELLGFLDMVKTGRVRRGSFLLVERVDRITRKGLDEGSDLLKQILKAGVSIVTLANGRVYGPEAVKGLMKGWLELEMHLEAAHEYSVALSGRVRAAWEVMRTKARGGTLVSAKMPPWLRAVGTGAERRAVVVPEKAALVQRIFDLAVAGWGVTRIVRALTRDGTPPLTGRAWGRTTLHRLLSDRAVLGEHQPTRLDQDGRRVKDGPPVENYFPAVVDEATFGKAQACLGGRRNRRAASESQVLNLFSGLLRDARSRTPDGRPVSYIVAGRVERNGQRHTVLMSRAHTGADGGKAASIPLDVFEAAALALLREVDPRELLPPSGEADEVLTLAGELSAVEARALQLEAELAEGGDVPALARVLRQLEARRKGLADRLADARLRAASPASEAWGEAKSLLDVLAAAPDPADAKLRLRAVLRRLVESVWLLVVPRGRDRLCAVQMWFTGGERRRDYLIYHRPDRANQHGVAKGGWSARSLADVAAPGDLDLRRPEDAHLLEQHLAEMDLGKFGATGVDRE
jgi:DNA invertase Pin-like site-specific DNA recombinase